MRKRFSLILAAALLLSACAAPAAPAEQPPAPAEPPAVIKAAVLKGPTALGVLPLIENPTLSDGTPLEIEVLGTPDVLVGRLAAGELDFATVPTNLAAKLYNKNPQYRMIAMNTWGSMYIIGSDVSVKTLADLKGKTLYSTGKGTTPDILLNYLLKQEGLDPAQDLTVDAALAPAELAQLAAAGKADPVLLPEPFVTMVLGKNPDFRILMDVKTLYQKALDQPDTDIAQTCLVVREAFLKERPEAVRAFMSAYEGALGTVTEDPAAAGALAEKHEILQSAALAEKAIPRCGIRYMSAADAQGAVTAFLSVLMANAPEDIGGKLPDEGFYVLQY